MLTEVFLAGGVRTAMGSFLGALADVGATSLGSAVVRAALTRTRLPPDQVDEVIMGNVLSAGLGQNVARQAAFGAGVPASVGAVSVNKVCGSGLKAVMLAAQAIQCGEAEAIVAGGTENMSQAPYLLPKARQGYRLGHAELVDSLIRDGLWDVANNVHMGTCGDRCAERYQFTRQDQDDFAVASYQRALQAQQQGWFVAEIVPVEVPGRKGTAIVDRDEEPSRFQEDRMRALKPAFSKDGTVTAGNASSINDGAAAMVVLAEPKVRQLGLQPMARILGYSTFSREPEWFTIAPVGAIDKLLKRLGWQVGDVDLFEVNEAFSVVPMAVIKDLGVPHERLNVHGGAVALGHPIGASGARVLVTLLHALQLRNARTGIAALCIGGGEAVAMAVERC